MGGLFSAVFGGGSQSTPQYVSVPTPTRDNSDYVKQVEEQNRITKEEEKLAEKKKAEQDRVAAVAKQARQRTILMGEKEEQNSSIKRKSLLSTGM